MRRRRSSRRFEAGERDPGHLRPVEDAGTPLGPPTPVPKPSISELPARMAGVTKGSDDQLDGGVLRRIAGGKARVRVPSLPLLIRVSRDALRLARPELQRAPTLLRPKAASTVSMSARVH